ncbi:ribosomal RNA-processing protein 7 homolog A isoform X2 [Durio zibethinus]|uniref:Ribosomal RNA-processing protein 7 homolog A isoform X2 n=1 Tax=Durio zibethinus TaxID=66656 RepID=A0A6P5XJ26_DURZI|nr:ribosomal RNA-processing protein 7 homolog A isoform X2 [Durio zibethinus]
MKKKKGNREKANVVDDGEAVQMGKYKKDRKMKKKDHSSSRESEQLVEMSKAVDEDEVYEIPSGDEDCSKGMKKWLTKYHQSRPGLKVLQQRIDDFIIAHETKLEQERKEKEARLTEGGWILVEHHKGRKKTTDSESGTTVGSVSQAVVEEKLAKKKSKELFDFYRFQKREAQKNELMKLQSKFEQDKKRIQQLRAARKFRPY